MKKSWEFFQQRQKDLAEKKANKSFVSKSKISANPHLMSTPIQMLG